MFLNNKTLIIYTLIIILSMIILMPKVFSEEIEININGNTKTLIISESKVELRKAYIEMSKLYLGERQDLEKLIIEYKEILKKLELYKNNLNEQNIILLKSLKDLSVYSLKKKLKLKLLTSYIQSNNNQTFDIGLSSEILEKITVYIGYEHPLNFKLSVGYYIFVF